MGITGCLKTLLVRSVEASLIIALIIFMPHLPPDTSFTAQPALGPARPFEGKLALNERLKNVERWHEGDLKGAEAFAVYKGELFASLYGGDVVKLVGEHITPVVKLGKPCKGVWQESTCGRPLGLRFDKDGALIVADAYYGIFKVNVATGEKVKLISMDEEIGGLKPKLCNSVAIASNGDIYWTDSTTDFMLEDGIFGMLGDPTGRLIHYNAATKKNTVLVTKINFANGILLSEDEDFVLVSETGANRILRYHLKGPKKGQQDIFIEGLPGLPDNLQTDGQGGVLVPLVFAVDAANPNLFQILRPFPYVRKFLARLMGLAQVSFKSIDQIYPNEVCQRAMHAIGHFETGASLITPKRTTVLQISKNGEIIDCLHSLDKLPGICEVIVHNNYLYLGSPFNDYIGRIPLAEAGLAHLKPTPSFVGKAQPQQQQQQQQQQQATPKPTTQAPKTPPPTQAPTTTRPPTTTTSPPPTTTTTTPRPTTTKAPATAAPTAAPTTKSPPPTKKPPPVQEKETPPPPQQQKQQTQPPVASKPAARAVPVGDGPKSESVRP